MSKFVNNLMMVAIQGQDQYDHSITQTFSEHGTPERVQRTVRDYISHFKATEKSRGSSWYKVYLMDVLTGENTLVANYESPEKTRLEVNVAAKKVPLNKRKSAYSDAVLSEEWLGSLTPNPAQTVDFFSSTPTQDGQAPLQWPTSS